MEKVTLVLGASPNPERFSYQSSKKLFRAEIYLLLLLDRRECDMDNLKIRKGMPEDIGPVHTITMYMNAKNQKEYYDYILIT